MGAALFFVALFFNPILSSIPPYATGPALILVGALMLAHVTHINWSSVQEAVPAFLTLCVMPLTYSIAYGEPLAFLAVHTPSWRCCVQKTRH